MTGSALYVGHVMHRRLGNPGHAFRYPLYLHLVDLDELPLLDATSRLFGYNRVRPVTFRDRDHLGDPARPVAHNIRAFLRGEGIADRVERVELLTSCRVLGYVFNPVSFYYCFGPGRHLVAIVAEVHNTFGERHCYVLRADRRTQGPTGAAVWYEKKVFHVSPFMTLDGTYEFEMTEPGAAIDIRIDLSRAGAPVFTSRLTLERRPMTDGALARALLRHPLMPWQVTAAIHRQALSLWRKRVPFHTKPPYDPEAARRGVA